MNTVKSRKTPLILACGLALLALPCAFANSDDSGCGRCEVQAMDANGDGRISRAEHAAGARKMFDKMDANHDGIVTAAEMDAASEAKADRAGTDQLSSAEKIKAIDIDGDGQLTAAEHARAPIRCLANGY